MRVWAHLRAVFVILMLAAAGLVAVTLRVPAAGATDAEGLRVVAAYAPSVLLYSSDTYRPAAASDLIAHANLRWAHDQSCPDHEVAARGHVDSTRLGDGGYQHQTASGWPACSHHDQPYTSAADVRPHGGKVGGEGFFLDLDNTARHGTGTGAPIYYEYQAHQFVTYWFFYDFNNALATVADHEGDWERISVRLDSQNHATAVAYYAHAGYCTVPWSAVPTSQAHPVAYSATGTHASFPTAGSHGLDQTNNGPRWNTWNSIRNARDQPWYGYGGAWGEVGETTDSTGPLGPSIYKAPAPTDWTKTC